MARHFRTIGAGGAALILSFALFSANRSAPASEAAAASGPAAPSEQPGPAIVARGGEVVLTRAELDSEIGEELSRMQAEHAEAVRRLERQTARELLDEKLLASRAKQQGLSPDQMVQREVTSKVAQPTQEELRALYGELQAAGEELGPFTEERPSLVDAMVTERAQAGMNRFLLQLRKQTDAKVLLAPLLPPRETVPMDGPAMGPRGAPVTIVAYVDLECPYCAEGHATLMKLRESYPQKLRIVHKDLPLDFHENAPRAAEAVHCAADQGKHGELQGRLYAHQSDLSEPALQRHAAAAGLDSDRFRTCMRSGEKVDVVEASIDDAEKIKVASTPTYFVNGRRLEGAQPLERFDELIAAELER